MYQIDDNHFVVCDAVFSTPIGCYVFEFLTKKGVQYRFSSNNKFLWEIDLKTNKKTKCKTNWVQLFQVGKKLLDQANHKYNRFCLMAHVVNFEGSSNGIYGVTPHSFPQLFDLAHEVKW